MLISQTFLLFTHLKHVGVLGLVTAYLFLLGFFLFVICDSISVLTRLFLVTD